MNCLHAKTLLCALAVLCAGNMLADRPVMTDVIRLDRPTMLNAHETHRIPEDPLVRLNVALKKYRGSVELYSPIAPNESEATIKIVPEGLLRERPHGVDCNDYYQSLVRAATFLPLLEELKPKQILFLQSAHARWVQGGVLPVHAKNAPKDYKRYCSLPEPLQHQRLFDVTHPGEALPYIGGLLKALRIFCTGGGVEYL